MPPTIVVLAGPNGAGKTTAAPYLLRDALGVVEFVNADTIAQGLFILTTATPSPLPVFYPPAVARYGALAGDKPLHY